MAHLFRWHCRTGRIYFRAHCISHGCAHRLANHKYAHVRRVVDNASLISPSIPVGPTITTTPANQQHKQINLRARMWCTPIVLHMRSVNRGPKHQGPGRVIGARITYAMCSCIWRTYAPARICTAVSVACT